MDRKIAKGLALFITAATVAVAPAASGAAARTEVDSAPAVKITWEPCGVPDPQGAGAECGLLDVPLDYGKPNGTKIQIAVSRIRSTVAAKDYRGVILGLPGGPGNPGLCTSSDCVPTAVGAAYDWIGFDPRGVGSSVPALSCDSDYFDPPRPEYVPLSRDIERTWLHRSKSYADACRASGGALLDHMTTRDTAKDVESIRKALGVGRINLYGISYGTYIGQVYGTLYPEKVRRMVLDSNIDPRKVWYQAALDQDVNFERNLRLWFEWVARFDDVYHLGRTADQVRQRWYVEQDKLRTAPAGGVVGPAEFTDIFIYAGYFQFMWPTLAELFAGSVHDPGAQLLVEAYESSFRPADDKVFAAYNAVQCTDARWPRSWNAWRRDNWRTFRSAPFATWYNAWYNAPCLFWPGQISEPVEVDGSKVRSVLFVGGTLDAVTPFEGSLEARRRFPNGSLLAEVGQTTHVNSFNGNPCITSAIADYLATGKLPPRKPGNRADATCTVLPPPDPTATSPQTTMLPAGNPAMRALLSAVRR
ncbi:alpha/beta hydrolase [Dactylosporangium sp. NPDC005555]|uniref:alpha/beta hydrolase n=1 Tax=Dactylosporangium sp. NPDC005555 TaxID=3154889 RepID=UPI0033BE6712